ncbi:hypothetical protein [Afifella pfennigii]|uniref:hypothetical protein n=1 Tax=Afifella pfennigii TaxID=209897 RepID=UPI00047E3F00|nr:hypothetical protein [Afifella pfennigii]
MVGKRLITLSLAPVLALLGASFAAAAGDCTCRASDGVIAREGETVCIATPNGRQMARCEKVLNNTSWRFLESPCPTASRPLPRLSRLVSAQP